MFSQKLLLPTIAFFGAVASAQSSSVCSQATATINSQADATALASCTTVSGSILISSVAAGSISLDGPEQVTGSVIAENAQGLTQFSSSSISTIGGSFTLSNLTTLSTLAFTDLVKVTTIDWSALPALSELTFTTGVSMASSVTITDTFLGDLNGINLVTVGTININNNNRLTEFSTQVANITDSLIIDSNGNSLKVELPNLIWAANITVRNVSSFSIPSLAVINGSLGFYENYFTSLMAPNLTAIGSSATLQGGLAIVANPSLSNISFPLLKTVGAQNQIANNSDLASGVDFPDLTFVGGAIDFSGNFTTPLMPDLTNVKGGFNIQSTNNISCTAFDSLRSSGDIQGVYTCKTTADATSSLNGTSTGTGTGTSSGASPSTSKKSSAASYGLSALAGSVVVIGSFMQIVL